MRLLSLSAIGICAVLSIACEKTPAAACAHQTELLETKAVSTQTRANIERACTLVLERMKVDDPARYKCGTECWMRAKDLDGLGECGRACPGFHPLEDPAQ
jgi:hypothetical protein